MKTSIIRRAALAVLALAMLLSAPTAHSQDATAYMATLNRLAQGEPIGGGLSAISTDVGMIVKYVGTGSGTVTVAAGGDITFKTGVVGSSVADTTLECPVSGALGGVIDVSDTACNTMGEVCDIINGTSSNWRCALLDSLRSDSSDDTLATMSETNGSQVNGLPLLKDSTVALNLTYALTPERTMRGFMAGTNLLRNPFDGFEPTLLKSIETTTYGSGTSTFSIISVLPNYRVGGTSSETVTTLWSQAAGATTAAQTFDATPFAFRGRPGEKLMIRVTNSAALTAGTIYAYGLRLPQRR